MEIATIPMRSVGPIKINSVYVSDEVQVPLATFETPLFPSVNRGAKVSRESDGISAVLVDDRMTRSVVVEAQTAARAVAIQEGLRSRYAEMAAVVEKTSRFAQLLDVHYQIVGRLLYIRFECSTGDAAGHNMVTKAADHLIQWLLGQYGDLKYISISGNFCTDKKVSAVNSILGRGKNVIAEMVVSRDICERLLNTTPEKIVELNIKKNLIGSIIAGSMRSANAHVANMLLAFYLATGQDAANIVEGSQAIVFAEMQNDDLYFSVTLPNIIVGTVGNGKELEFVKHNLEMMHCLDIKDSAKRLAIIAAATVLCGELSLLAAQTNPGELMRCHEVLERKNK